MEEENKKLIGKDYTFRELALMSASPVITQMMMSLLSSLDDSLFISRYLGQEALSAFSLGSPVFMIMNAFAGIFSGCSTLCAAKMGEKRNKEASANMTSVAIIAALAATVAAVILRLSIKPILVFLGCEGKILEYGLTYYSNFVMSYPLMIMSNYFAAFYVTAGKPKLNLVTTAVQAFCNFFFDWLFIVVLKMGLESTAYANILGFAFCTVFGLIFYSGKKCEIGFGTPTPYAEVTPVLTQTIRLGYTQCLTSISVAISAALAHFAILHAAGEIGVSASSICDSVQFIFMSGFWGVSKTVCPMISYAYGEKNPVRIKKIVKQFISLELSLSVIVIAVYYLSHNLLASLYFGENTTEELISLVTYGLLTSPPAYIFFCINISAQDTFTSLENSRTSAVLAFIENIIWTNICSVGMVLLWGMHGYFWAFAAAEGLASVSSIAFLFKYADVYGYGKSGKATKFAV